MTVPFAFANLSGNIALSKLDSNFNTPITIGNTSVLLGNTVTTLNNLTLANVTITSGTSNIANVNVTNIAVTNLTATLANVTTLNVASASITSANIGNLSLTNALSVANGGTGRVTLPANNVLVGNGTGGIATVAPGNVGNVLTSIGGAWVSNAVVSNAAAGSNTQVQYNNSGALGASANLVFDGTNLGLGITPSVWGVNFKALQVSYTGVSYNNNNGNSQYTSNVYWNASNAPVYISSSFATQYTQAYTTGQHQWFNAPSGTAGNPITFTPAMTLDASGNLGIGTSSPGAKLQVGGDGSSNIAVPSGLGLRVLSGTYQNTGGTGFIQLSGGYGDAGFIGAWNISALATTPGSYATNNQLTFSTVASFSGTVTERMRLDSSGNLGIGTSSPGAKLDVNGNALVNGLSLGKGISSGIRNTVFGLDAGFSQTTGPNNTIIGSGAGFSITTGRDCTFIGRAAGNGGSGNANGNTGVGEFAVAGGSAIGGGNTGIGDGGILANTNSTSAIYNSGLGSTALNQLTSGNYNTALGAFSLNLLTTEINCSGLGAYSAVTGSNQIQLGDSATTTYVYGTVQNRSDIRDKADVRDTQLGLSFINALRPVDYKLDMRDDYKPTRPEKPEDPTDPEYKIALSEWREACKLSNLTHDGSKKRLRYHHGLIAQEVKAVLDAQGIDFGGYQDHKIKGGDDVLSIGYDELIAPLIKSIQELTARIAQLEAK